MSGRKGTVRPPRHLTSKPSLQVQAVATSRVEQLTRLEVMTPILVQAPTCKFSGSHTSRPGWISTRRRSANLIFIAGRGVEIAGFRCNAAVRPVLTPDLRSCNKAPIGEMRRSMAMLGIYIVLRSCYWGALQVRDDIA